MKRLFPTHTNPQRARLTPQGRPSCTLVHGSRQSGSIAIEFALMIPILMTILLGSIEVARYALIHQKIHRVSSYVANAVTQMEPVTQEALADTFLAASILADPFDFNNNGRIFVTAVSDNNGNARIVWQEINGGLEGADSEIGDPGHIAILPDGITVREDAPLITSEVYMRYTPLFLENIIPARIVSVSSYYRPRSEIF